MDDNAGTVPIPQGEDPEFSIDDWRADVARYMDVIRPDERQPGEFSRSEYEHHRGITRAMAETELARMMALGVIERRLGLEAGKWLWLYKFVQNN